jgi:DNA-binding MarR family transcriptional regulator
MNSIRRIVQALRRSSRAAEKDWGLSGARLFVLQQLREGRPLSINELAARTATHQSSVSAVVSKLHEQGLTTRTESPDDARVSLIGLTAQGKTLVKKTPRPTQELIMAGISRLSAREQKQLSELLEKLVHAAELDQEPATMFFEDISK